MNKKAVMKVFNGIEAGEFIDQIGRLRISMFAEFPYLYKGTIEDERAYLPIYCNSRNSRIILFFDQDQLVGFSSSVPLVEEYEVVQEPFIANNIDRNQYLYVGEIMLLKEYRSFNNVYDIIKIHDISAREQGFSFLTALTVDREENHPAKPEGYRDLAKLWQKCGWEQPLNLKAKIEYPRVDLGTYGINMLSVWTRKVQAC